MNKLLAGVAVGVIVGYMACDNSCQIKKMLNKGKKKVATLLD